MNAPPALAIGHLRARAAVREPVVARLAAEALAAEVASALPPLPPQAVLMLRRLELALPGRGLDRLPDYQMRQRLASDARDAIAAAAATAGRPALGVIATETAAVLFGDEAELLACLARDGLAGRLDAWWWRSLLGGGYPDWTRAWMERPRAAPAALRLLARAGLAKTVVRVLEAQGALADGAAEALRVIGKQGGPPWPATIDNTASVSAGMTAGALRVDAAAVSAASPITPPPAAPVKNAADETGANRGLQPRGSTAAGATPAEAAPPVPSDLADTREAAPAGATRSAESPPIPPDSAGPGVAAVPPSAVDADKSRSIIPAMPAQPPIGADVQAPSAVTPDDRPLSEPDYQHRVRSEHRADPGLPADTLEPSSLPAEVARQFARLVHRVARHRQAGAASVSGHTDTMIGRTDNVIGVTVKPDRPTPPEQIPDAIHPNPDAAALDATPQVIVSRYARLFFLVNLLLGDGLYPDFTRPLDPGFPVPLWRMLALLGAKLAGPALCEDALWLLLERLGAELPTRDEPDFEQHWPTPADESVDKQPLGDTSSGVPDFAGWLARYVGSVRARLAPALGVRPARVGRLLPGEPARIWVSAAEIVVVYSLEHHPVQWRLAGLDRDPGYLPSAGRGLRFIFE